MSGSRALSWFLVELGARPFPSLQETAHGGFGVFYGRSQGRQSWSGAWVVIGQQDRWGYYLILGDLLSVSLTKPPYPDKNQNSKTANGRRVPLTGLLGLTVTAKPKLNA